MLILHPSSCCDVCLEGYSWDASARRPHAIPCGHTFCKTCLRAIRPSKCPLCRNPFVLGTTKKLHVGRVGAAEQDLQEIELLRRLALSWGAPNNEQVKVMEEIDAWLADQQAEKSMPIRNAREAVAFGQQLMMDKEGDSRTIRDLRRDVLDIAVVRRHSLLVETSLLDKCSRFEEKVAQYEAEMECMRAENNRKVAQYEAKMEGLRAENDRKIAQYEVKVECLKAEIGRRKAVKPPLIEAGTIGNEELKAAQVFPTKTDTLSITDVARQVTALNQQIFQMAACLGGLLQDTESPDQPGTEVMKDVSWMLGKQMASVLGAGLFDGQAALNGCRTVPKPLLANVVFQIAITRWCKFMISSWKPGDHSTSDFMASLYSGICQFEDPAVCGPWRSITRAQLRLSSCNDSDWSDSLMQGLDSVLNVAGRSIRDRRLFETRLPLLFGVVKNLRDALGEDITTLDLEVVTIEAGTVFNAASMKANWMSSLFISSQKEGTPERVIGTTGLGLSAQKGHIHHQVEMVLLPQVVLEGVFRGS